MDAGPSHLVSLTANTDKLFLYRNPFMSYMKFQNSSLYGPKVTEGTKSVLVWFGA